MEDSEGGLLEYEIVREFLAEGDEETVNIAVLKRLEQERKIMEKFV